MEQVAELSVWIESMESLWRALGVGVLSRDGQTLFMSMNPTGQLSGILCVWVGTVESCRRVQPVESEFIPLIVLGDISVEHSKVLIENAVGQVAGR